MSLINLSPASNWRLIAQEEKRVRVTSGNLSSNNSTYRPIDPTFTLANSSTVLVGVTSESALPYWYLGARVSQYSYVSPSSARKFIAGVQTSEQKRIRLNQLTLINFEDYRIYPYVLATEFPYWLEHIYYEAWEYTGSYQSNSDILRNLQDEVRELRLQVEQLTG